MVAESPLILKQPFPATLAPAFASLSMRQAVDAFQRCCCTRDRHSQSSLAIVRKLRLTLRGFRSLPRSLPVARICE